MTQPTEPTLAPSRRGRRPTYTSKEDCQLSKTWLELSAGLKDRDEDWETIRIHFDKKLQENEPYRPVRNSKGLRARWQTIYTILIEYGDCISEAQNYILSRSPQAQSAVCGFIYLFIFIYFNLTLKKDVESKFYV